MRTSICLLALLGIGGCGGDDNSSSTSVATNTVFGPGAAEVTVQVGPGAFSPATITINAGDSVTWVWTSGPHTVTSGSPTAGGPDGRFCSVATGKPVTAGHCNSTSYAQGAGATFTWTFLEPGTFHYFSTPQGAAMTGTIIVVGP